MISRLLKRFATGVVIMSIASTITASEPSQLWPDIDYDPKIPTVHSVLGYHAGERITNHADMVKYFEALAEAAPDRIKIFDYAKSWEGRRLIYAAIAKPQTIENLDPFADFMQQLSQPSLIDEKKAEQLIQTLPASTWLAYGVHGNEISSTDAAMFTAYHLVAAVNDPITKKIFDHSVVFIDPLQNPDGRERFTSRYYATVGLEHSPDRYAAEHNEPWPSGRTNHYLFDMNRDWLAATQPETQGRIALLNRYKPLVFIDLHEMGGDQSYYFAPAAQPFNPHMTDTQIANMNLIGRNHGRHFDQFGFDYFTREIFDAFYPGYGDSWPTFYGASASTYEVASSRGEIYRKKTGELLTYQDTVQQHFVASISTAEAVADNREKLLRDFYNYQVSAIELGEDDDNERVYIIPKQSDRAGAHRLATLMATHGVQVEQATQDFRACGKKYQAGTFFIDSAQPKGRFVKTTMTQNVEIDKDFIKEQERRRARKLNDEIYDVTGWSLPLMFNLDVDPCGDEVDVASTTVTPDLRLTSQLTQPTPSVGFVVPWGDMASGRFLTAALQAGLVVKSASEAFTLESGKQYPAGSLIIEKRLNPIGYAKTVQTIAQQTGAIIDGVDTSWVVKGPSFGSNKTVQLKAPKIAIAWDEATSSLSAGNTRFVIERQFQYPVTAIRAQHLNYADLDRYDVIILPNGRYQQALGASGADKLKRWVQDGGVLISFSGATRFLASAEINLLNTKREQAVVDSSVTGAEDNDDSSTVKGTLLKQKDELITAIENAKRPPDNVAGVLTNVEVDQEHWLTAGVKPNVVTLTYGRDIYSPIKLASGKNLAWYASPEKVLASGYLWEENKHQLAYKPYLIHQPLGSGMIISYAMDPTFRAYLDGLNIMLMNSLFRAPAHAR